MESTRLAVVGHEVHQTEQEFTMSEDRNVSENWSAAAEIRPDVFGLPKIAPQGQDGVAHFNYYDPERALSFQWDGRMDQHITVSQGGYGEPVKWTFDFMDAWNILPRFRNGGPVIQSPFLDPCLHFKGVCDLWIESMEKEGF